MPARLLGSLHPSYRQEHKEKETLVFSLDGFDS